MKGTIKIAWPVEMKESTFGKGQYRSQSFIVTTDTGEVRFTANGRKEDFTAFKGKTISVEGGTTGSYVSKKDGSTVNTYKFGAKAQVSIDGAASAPAQAPASGGGFQGGRKFEADPKRDRSISFQSLTKTWCAANKELTPDAVIAAVNELAAALPEDKDGRITFLSLAAAWGDTVRGSKSKHSPADCIAWVKDVAAGLKEYADGPNGKAVEAAKKIFEAKEASAGGEEDY